MNIKLLRPADENLVNETIVKWNLSARTSFWAIFSYLLVAILYLFIGLVFEYPINGIWNYAISIAICFTLLSVITAFNLYKGRNKWIQIAKSDIQNQEKDVPFEYNFTEMMVTIRSTEAYSEVKWSLIPQYKLHKQYIFLYVRNYNVSTITIDSTYLSEDDYNTLFSFISTHLTEIK